jgi:hypothetical protein
MTLNSANTGSFAGPSAGGDHDQKGTWTRATSLAGERRACPDHGSESGYVFEKCQEKRKEYFTTSLVSRHALETVGP